jgi:hypothetical protein
MTFFEQDLLREKINAFYELQMPILCEQLGTRYNSRSAGCIPISNLITVLSNDEFSNYWNISPANNTIKNGVDMLRDLQRRGHIKSPILFILSVSHKLNCLFDSSFYSLLNAEEVKLFFDIRKHLAQVIVVFNNGEIV